MKVICSIWGDLIDESEAIRMNHVDIKLKKQEICGILDCGDSMLDTNCGNCASIITHTYPDEGYNRYGQICLSCHTKKSIDEDTNRI